MKRLLSIIIPVFNEGTTLKKLTSSVIHAKTPGFRKEIIIVNDGSTDSSRHVLKQLKSKSIRVLSHTTNRGKGASLRSGIMKSTGSIVLIQDADLEYDPADYPRLLEPFLEHDADVVYGSRFISERPHRVLYFWHSVGNKFLTLLSNICTDLNLTDMETGYKVFRGDLIREIAPQLKSNRFGFEPEITARIAKIPNVKIFEIGISYWGRTYAEGKKINWKDGFAAAWHILYFNFFS